MKKRQFLKHSALASASLMVPSFLRDQRLEAVSSSSEGRILVVVQLSGGNDGLNTIVPYRNDIYYRNRPEIGIASASVLKNHDELGFNPAMSTLQPIFDEGQVCVLNDVGYPNPDRSHFRSMDIWHTASDPSERLQHGWLGRYLDSDCPGCHLPYHSLEIGDHVSLANHGKRRDALAMRGPKTLERAAGNDFLRRIGKDFKGAKDPALDFLYKQMIEVQESAHYLTEKAKTYRSSHRYPNHAFGEGMRQIAELITAGTNTKIYYVSMPGFDTHVNQKARQHQLLTIYAEAVSTFVKDLKSNGLFENVMVLTFSEFGRRVAENTSQGTDHGAANNLLLIGDKLRRPGYFNGGPILDQLDDGDLAYRIDFRSIYAQILDQWLLADAQSILGLPPKIDDLFV
jgi:uncharacterized protein (DUF1501 family)